MRCDVCQESLPQESMYCDNCGAVAGPRDHLVGMILEGSFGKYRIDAYIDSGGQAAVYSGIHLESRERVALKFLPPATARDADLRKRLEHERDLLARLRHPSIVSFRDFAGSGITAAIVMDLVEGTSLSKMLEPGAPMPTGRLRPLALPIVGALAHAHASGVVHRDVKPANVLVTNDGKPMLLDFGIAMALDGTGPRTLTGALAGTPAYMSPEQCRGARTIDHRTDIYSVGVLLYQLATGRVPFERDSDPLVMKAHMEDPVPLPRTRSSLVSPQLEQVILRCLQKAPEDRFQGATEVFRALESLKGGGEAGALREPDMAGGQSRAAPTRIQSQGVSAGGGGGAGVALLLQRPAYLVAALMALAVLVVGVPLIIVAAERESGSTPPATDSTGTDFDPAWPRGGGSPGTSNAAWLGNEGASGHTNSAALVSGSTSDPSQARGAGTGGRSSAASGSPSGCPRRCLGSFASGSARDATAGAESALGTGDIDGAVCRGDDAVRLASVQDWNSEVAAASHVLARALEQRGCRDEAHYRYVVSLCRGEGDSAELNGACSRTGDRDHCNRPCVAARALAANYPAAGPATAPATSTTRPEGVRTVRDASLRDQVFEVSRRCRGNNPVNGNTGVYFAADGTVTNVVVRFTWRDWMGETQAVSERRPGYEFLAGVRSCIDSGLRSVRGAPSADALGYRVGRSW